MKAFYKVLRFFNLMDRESNLSITNVILIVILTKFVINPSFSIEECIALMLAILNYAHKRYEVGKADKLIVRSIDELKFDIELNKTTYSSQIESLKKELSEVKAVSEDAKDKATKLSNVTSLKTLNVRG